MVDKAEVFLAAPVSVQICGQAQATANSSTFPQHAIQKCYLLKKTTIRRTKDTATAVMQASLKVSYFCMHNVVICLLQRTAACRVQGFPPLPCAGVVGMEVRLAATQGR